MPPAKSANPAPRRRTRKRKRRAVSVSSSSSSSESSSPEDDSSPEIVRRVPETPKPVEESSESELNSDTSDSSSSVVAASKDKLTPTPSQKPDQLRKTLSPSPSPPPIEIPSFLPPRGDASAEEKEKELKDRFRKFWMSSVADGFRDDLEELRKVRVQAQTVIISRLKDPQEPNLGTGRLALLIDSLALGAEVFSSKVDGDVSEMDVMMGSQES